MANVRELEELPIPGPRHKDGSSAIDPKNQARMEPLCAPDLYARHFDGKEDKIAVGMKDGTNHSYELLQRIDDPKTSFAASVLLDKTTGHAIILYKGMDLPGRNEGSGHLGFVEDLGVARAAARGGDNIQTPPAEKAYLDTLNDPRVKSLEVVGYSIGSLHLNTMAAKYGARGTAIADMGISDNVLSSVFNKGASGEGLHSTSEINTEMQTRITSLKKEWDMLPASHAASPARGTVIELDQGNWKDILGIAHIPQVYAADADIMLKARATGGMAP